MQKELLNELKNAIRAKIGTNNGWQLFADQDDTDSKTLLFEYQSKISNTDYIRPIVKIEIGARSEHWPVSNHVIYSYTKEALKEKIHESETQIRVLNAERTFWEKATILHQYAHLPEGKILPPRISRHFYDFFRLLFSSVEEITQALADKQYSKSKISEEYFKKLLDVFYSIKTSLKVSYDTSVMANFRIICEA